MCLNNFKVTVGAAVVCEAVADFAALPLVRELLVKASLKDMFASIEANAAKTLMLSRALNADISDGYAEIQWRVDEEHARNEALSSEDGTLFEKVRSLEAQVAVLEAERAALRGEVADANAERAALRGEVQSLRSVRTSLEEEI